VAGAEADVRQSATAYRLEDIDTVIVDTSMRPKPRARQLAEAMAARYVPLPNANAERISASVQRNLAA
jgi:magnesium chelatase subunit D